MSFGSSTLLVPIAIVLLDRTGKGAWGIPVDLVLQAGACNFCGQQWIAVSLLVVAKKWLRECLMMLQVHFCGIIWNAV